MELEYQPPKRVIALMLMIFTIIIAGRMTVIITASGDKTSALDNQKRRGSNPDAFVCWVLDEVYNSPLCFHIRLDVALGGGERSVSSQHLNVSQ